MTSSRRSICLASNRFEGGGQRKNWALYFPVIRRQYLYRLLLTTTHHTGSLKLVLLQYFRTVLQYQVLLISWTMSADSSDSDISSDELESPSRATGASQKRTSTASLKRTGNPNEPKKVKGPRSSLQLAKYKSITSFFGPCSVPIVAELISLPGSSIVTRLSVIYQ